MVTSLSIPFKIELFHAPKNTIFVLKLWNGLAWQLTFMEDLLIARQCWKHLIHLTTNLFEVETIILIILIYLWGNQGTESLNNMLKK